MGEARSQGSEKVEPIWGDHVVPDGRSIGFEIGTLQLEVARSPRDVTIDYRYSQDRFVKSSDDVVTRVRTAVSGEAERIRLQPAPGDRDVVVRPTHHLVIPPAGNARLFVSSPAWLRVMLGDDVCLVDVATEILSDTWLGPDTRNGQLAYADETQARMLVTNLPFRPHRMVTPISITNEGEEPLQIARLGIPVPQFAVYVDVPTKALWSSAVDVVCEAGLATARIEIDEAAPAHLTEAVQLAEPRVSVTQGSLTRAIGLLFG